MMTLEASRSLMSFPLQKTLFGFLVMVCDKVDDGDKSSYENFGLARHCFHGNYQSLKN